MIARAAALVGLLALSSLSHAAPGAPPGRRADEPVRRRFLHAPVWYLSYSVTVTAKHESRVEDGSNWSTCATSSHHSFAQEIPLDVRQPGGSLMADTKLPMPKPLPGGASHADSLERANNAMLSEKGALTSFVSRLEDGGTWLRHPAPLDGVETMDQMKAVTRAWAESLEARTTLHATTVTVRYEAQHGESPDACTTTVRRSRDGTGPASPIGSVLFEIDAASGRYGILLPYRTSNPVEPRKVVQVQEQTTVEFSGNSGGHGPGGESTTTDEEELSWSGQPKPLDVREASGLSEQVRLVDTLPEAFGPIRGSRQFPATVTTDCGEVNGTVDIQYTLSPTPPEEVEFVLFKPKDYQTWRPMAGNDESAVGNMIELHAELRKKGGGAPKAKAIRFIYKLLNTSREKGVCLNWPAEPKDPPPCDLKFEAAYNPRLEVQDPDGQTAVESGDGLTAASVAVTSYDWGGWADLEISAKLDNGDLLTAVVEGSGGEQALRLPRREPDSKIAAAVLDRWGVSKYGDFDDDEDDPHEDGPAAARGDGFTLYEEYRGFWNGPGWIELDPKKKDVFVLNGLRSNPYVLRGIRIYEAATGLRVHSLLERQQASPARVVNCRHTAGSHLVDQHAIYIQSENQLLHPDVDHGGAAHVEEVGTPGTARSVHMPLAWPAYRTVLGRRVPYFERTIAHEMMHSSNVYHHGEVDNYDIYWRYDPGPPSQVIETLKRTEVDPATNATRTVYDDLGWVVVKKEDGTSLSPEKLFPNRNQKLRVMLGVQSGQHSGGDGCIQRYWIATAYPGLAGAGVRYLSPGEIRNTSLCTTAAGSGVNAPDHKPQSRYGPAAAPGANGVQGQRGDCKGQIRVTDLGEEPKR